jgi:hypothetical protein
MKMAPLTASLVECAGRQLESWRRCRLWRYSQYTRPTKGDRVYPPSCRWRGHVAMRELGFIHYIQRNPSQLPEELKS